MRFRKLLLVIMLLVSGCVSLSSINKYYPKETFSDFTMEWYGSRLRALLQKPLFPLATKPSVHIYRFLYLRTFDSPICLTLRVKSNGSGVVTFVSTSREDGYEPGKLDHYELIPLNANEIKMFLQAIDDCNFWSMTTETVFEVVNGVEEETVGVDGSQWILEAVKDGHYHVTDRWSPQDGKYREALLLLLRLSGQVIDPMY
jgi:hypothetical protein